MLSGEVLREIHTKVYKESGYPTIEDGLRAFKRGRKWAKKHPGNRRPPRGIADKLGLTARVNKEIQITMIKKEEDAKNAEIKRNQDEQAKRVNEVPKGTEK